MNSMNNLYKRYIFWKFKREAKSKYRVLQRNENTYEIQVFMDVGINVSMMQWSRILSDKLNKTSTVDDYKKVCDELRQSYYYKLVNEFTVSEKKKELIKKYPKVIY